MLTFVYDGSFAGLLSAIYQSYYKGEKPEQILSPQEAAENLFAENITIDTNQDQADKVYYAIKRKISDDALHHIYYAYLSELPLASNYIYQYLELGWRIGAKLDMHLNDPVVSTVHIYSQKVGKEKHRMLGLLRFQELEQQVYYAPMEPDHNIAILLAPHFAKRLADQSWIIHDIKRRIAVLYNQQDWVVTTQELTGTLTVSEDESKFQDLWQCFYKNISITSRLNPLAQKRFMPTRYWHHLPERKG